MGGRDPEWQRDSYNAKYAKDAEGRESRNAVWPFGESSIAVVNADGTRYSVGHWEQSGSRE